MMKRAYVVMEGMADVKILQKLLPENIEIEVKFVVSGGRSSLRSLARSILIAKQLPTALIMDGDTTDEVAIQEQIDFLQWYMRQGSAQEPFRIIVAKPEIESIFLQDRAYIENLANEKFSDREWELAKSDPKKFLTLLFGNGSPGSFVNKFFSNADDRTLDSLRQHPVVTELNQFLNSVLKRGLEPV